MPYWVGAGIEHRGLSDALTTAEDANRAVLPVGCLAEEANPTVEHDEEARCRLALDEQHCVALVAARHSPSQEARKLILAHAGKERQLA
ncbi:MAG TPA: hypothetical protein VFY87_19800, partial [Geminicoccaceae bacterium]|nr:hypothetical protein [Geminicoccaceae bacterium]